MPPGVKARSRSVAMPPHLRILFYLVFVLSLYAIRSLPVLSIFSGILLLLLLRIPFRKLKTGWVPITLFITFTFLSNVFNHHGKILGMVGPLFITSEGLQAGLLRTVRLFLMIGGLKVLMAGTPTGELISAIGRIFMPLERLGLPVKDFIHTLGLTLQCFPVLKDRGTELYSQQLALQEGKGFSGRVKVIATFMVPLFVLSVRTPEIFFETGGTDGKKN